MQQVIINPKFKALLAPLTAEEYAQLEQSIIAHGCETAIDIWRSQIIDGHNRYEICVKHDKAFRTKDRTVDFATEDLVLEWIYVNQLGRRNLNPNQKLLYIGQLYELQKKRHGGDRGNQYTVDDADVLPSRQIDDLADSEQKHESTVVYDEYSQIPPIENESGFDTPSGESTDDGLDYELDEQFRPRSPRRSKPINRTATKIAKDFGVSSRTVERAATVAKAVNALPEHVQRTFIAGKLSQTAVIEQARKITEPTFVPETPVDPADTSRDDFTEMCTALSKRLHDLFGSVADTIAAARLEFVDRGQSFDEWCSHLAAVSFDIPLLDVKNLKSLRICVYCAGEKCPLCRETGYLSGAHYRMAAVGT